MNIEYYNIKTEMQKNGLWGMPMNLIKMQHTPLDVDCNLHSAIIVALDEIHKTKFKIINQSNDSCLIYYIGNVFKDNIIKNMYVVKYDNFFLEGNRLYYIKNEQEKRYLKLNKIDGLQI